MEREQATPAAQRKETLERIKSGEATINDARAEHGLGPVKDEAGWWKAHGGKRAAPYRLELSFEQLCTIDSSLCRARKDAEADLARMLKIADGTDRAERAALAGRLADDCRSEAAAITDALEAVMAAW